MKNILKKCPIVLIDSCYPIVIAVNKNQSIKIALNSKNQMPNINSLISFISQTLSNAPQDTAHFTILDLQYAYSQLNLHTDTARHCNFNFVSVDTTGTFCFKTGFYGLTDMPTEFQKAIDCTLAGLNNIVCLLDDILIVSTGRTEDHLDLKRKCLIKLDEENLGFNLAKNQFAKGQFKLLGHRITQLEIITQSIIK